MKFRIRNMIGHSAIVIFIALLAGWGLAMSLIGGLEIFPGNILAFDDSFEHFVKYPSEKEGCRSSARIILEVTFHQEVHM